MHASDSSSDGAPLPDWENGVISPIQPISQHALSIKYPHAETEEHVPSQLAETHTAKNCAILALLCPHALGLMPTDDLLSNTSIFASLQKIPEDRYLSLIQPTNPRPR